ncbi:hypothetical protein [Francisella salimarina]|uniref:hypothetical protein n=1 Tax=Francisella salimarina TaxID=2599927 RepID=UPI003D8136F4
MNTNKFYYHLMKLNVLSSDYVDESYKVAWKGNVYPFFHDSKYEFHYEVAKYFDRADEKTIDKLCSLLDDYIDEKTDFSKFEEKVEKVVGKGNVFYVLDYVFKSGQYQQLLENVKLNKMHFSQHFIDRFVAGGYFD